jgi:type IX secretion system PorP/SprF family membrane protein
MKKNHFLLVLASLVFSMHSMAQSDQHYTMFMYNKLQYNPGYTGSREVTSMNVVYRKQWTDIPGAPRTINLSVDAPLGTYMRPFRKMALGFSIGSEMIGTESYDNLRAYYAYRMQLKKSVVSFGLSAGSTFYSANYFWGTGYPTGDPSFAKSISYAMLPNFGTGVYWSGSNFYCGLSVPNMLQNYYDKDNGRLTSKQIRTYYLSGGYSFATGDEITIQPQVLARYAMNGKYSLPFNADINLSATAYKRFMMGLTYRTSGSIEGIVHVQISRRINMGYAYDYMMSALNGYSGGTHEIVFGFDFVRDNFKFLTPRFIRKF